MATVVEPVPGSTSAAAAVPADPSLRIGLVTHRFAPSTGGVETHVEQLARALARAGHRPEVFTHDLGHGAPSIERHGGVTVRRFPRLVAWEHGSISPALLGALRRGRIPLDLVHVHSYHDPVSVLAAAAWSGPLVVTPHYHRSSADAGRDLMHRVYRPLAGRAYARADAAIAVSAAERSTFVADFAGLADRTTVIGNGLDTDRFTSATADPALRGDRTIVVAGRLERYKRVELLLAAAEHLRHDDVVHVVGDGPDRGRLEGLVPTSGARVRFWGRVDDDTYATLVASADVVASASTHEAQGISALEGLVCGARVALSDIGPYRDVAERHPDRVRIVASETAEDWSLAITEMAGRERRPVPVDSWDDIARAVAATYRGALVAAG